MAPRTSTKTKAAAEPAAATKPQDKPTDEQQEQAQQAAQAAQGEQTATPPDGPTADYIEAVGFILNEAGDVVGADGHALPPVFAGDDGEAMVLQALALACVPALAPAGKQVSVLTVDVDASAVTQAVSQAGEIIGSQAVADVLAERARQIAKGYTVEHDKQHRPEALAKAGISFAMLAADLPRPLYFWPFSETPNSQRLPREQLVRAAAMMLAAIEAHDARAEA